MGLDITAVSKVEEVSDMSDYGDESYNFFYTGANYDFLIHLDKLKAFKYYHLTTKSEKYSFCCGAYSGYNMWRNQLAIMLGYVSDFNVFADINYNIRRYKLNKIQGHEQEFKPFYLLIFFSDCEGIIGPETSKKLYNNFIEFDKIAKKQDKNFYKKYCDWKEAFRIASDNGLVYFH